MLKNHYYMSHYYSDSSLLRKLLFCFTFVSYSLRNLITIICPLFYRILLFGRLLYGIVPNITISITKKSFELIN